MLSREWKKEFSSKLSIYLSSENVNINKVIQQELSYWEDMTLWKNAFSDISAQEAAQESAWLYYGSGTDKRLHQNEEEED